MTSEKTSSHDLDLVKDTGTQQHIEHLYDENLKVDAIIQQSKLATEKEHELTFRQAVKKYPWAVFWAFGMSLTIIMEGYDFSLMGSFFAYPAFKQKFGTFQEGIGYTISGPWQVGLGNGAGVGTVIGVFINGFLTEQFGHRRVIMVALIFMTAFIFVSFFAPNVQVLLVGQILCGIPWGVFATMGPSYSSEVCPLALRGYLTAYVNMCWATGQLISAGVLKGLVTNTTEWSFRIPFAIQWVWPIPLFAMAYFAPESPWWLVRRGRLEQAERSVIRLQSKNSDADATNTVAMMVHTNKLEKELYSGARILDCFKGVNLRRTEIGCMVFAGQVLSGSAFAYSPSYFFSQAGLDSSDTYIMNLVGTSIAFVGTAMSWFLLYRFGRRTIYLGGLSFMTLLMLIVGVTSYPALHSAAARWGQAAVTLLWLGVYSLTIGPITYVIVSEMSATRLRAQSIAMARNSYNIVRIIANVVEPYLINPTEANLKGKTAFVWFATSSCTLIWAYFRLPESGNRTYEELDMLFENRIPARKFSKTVVDLYGSESTVEHVNSGV